MASLPKPSARNGISIEGEVDRVLLDCDACAREVPQTVKALIASGLDDLPLPGHGTTLTRWRTLARVAAFDLAVVKLFESHVDALAILQELENRAVLSDDLLYAVWAAESPGVRFNVRSVGRHERLKPDDRAVIDGSKAWCSGALSVDMALVTATDSDGGRWLVEVRLDQQGITITDDRWHAVGMARTGTADVLFEAVEGRIVGASNAYLQRPGFWHGGAGIAACWFGAAADVGARVRDLQRERKDMHARAHLARIDAQLAAMAALLRESASLIDASPRHDGLHHVLRLRAAVAESCEVVLHEAMHALGPGPFCTDRRLARHAADLPIFIRQMRAEHDLVAQADALLSDEDMSSVGWTL